MDNADVSAQVLAYAASLDACDATYQEKESECPELDSMRCFSFLREMHYEVQACYKKVAADILQTYYGLDAEAAEKRVEDYRKFIYDNYLFIYAQSDFCKVSCGVSPYLYSDYATTENLATYLDRLLRNIKARE